MTQEASRAERSDRLRIWILCAAKTIRTFGFGAVSVIFAIYLQKNGFNSEQIGIILAATLVEDAMLTALVTSFSARLGVMKILLFSSVLIICSGFALAFLSSPLLIVLVSIFGIISPAGFEGGPFGSIEQALISESVHDDKLARTFSNYGLAGFAGAAAGSLLAGYAQDYSYLFITFALGGILLLALYSFLALKTPAVAKIEPLTVGQKKSSSAVVWKFSLLQGLDAFGGGFIPQTLIAFWFLEKYAAGPEVTGPLFFWLNIFAAVSFLVAPYFCRRFGLLNTMVFTHLPCSLALCLVPFMPTANLAIVVMIARSFFSSMDIPARQAYSMLIVAPDERPAVAGLTFASRAIAQCVAPLISGWTLAGTFSGLAFVCAGSCKSVYDIVLFSWFRKVPLSSESRMDP